MLTHVLFCGICAKDMASAGAAEVLLPSDSEPIIEEFMENCSSSWTSKLPVETPVTRLQADTRETPPNVAAVQFEVFIDVTTGVRPS